MAEKSIAPPSMLRPVGNGRAIMLHGILVKIGRGVTGEHDILIPQDDAGVSREHAMLYLEDNHWHVEDTSRNGTIHNGRVLKQENAMLRPGDKIQIGRTFDCIYNEIEPTRDSLQAGLPSRLHRDAGTQLAQAQDVGEDVPAKSGLWISPSAVIWRDGESLSAGLSRTEYRLIKFLASRPGEICDYDSVVQAVWGDLKSKASLHELIFRVRRKIELDAALPKYLIIRSGIGVVFFPMGEPG